MSISFCSIWRYNTDDLPYSTGARERGSAGARERGIAEVRRCQALCRVCKGGRSVCLKRNNSLVFGASEVSPVSIESS
jgi:hypothetical protein